MKSLKRILPLALILVVSMNSCNLLKKDKALTGYGSVNSKEYSIGEYTSIVLEGNQNIYYEQNQGLAPYLRIEMDGNLHPFVNVEVKKNKLTISDSEDISPTVYNVYTNSRAISSIKSKGDNNITLEGQIKAKELEIEMAGSGNLEIEGLHVKQLSLKIAGSGLANIVGIAQSASFQISGSGKIEALSFPVEEIDAKISGSGLMNINVSESLDAVVSGSGDIDYLGSPKKLNQKISGIGRITQMQSNKVASK